MLDALAVKRSSQSCDRNTSILRSIKNHSLSDRRFSQKASTRSFLFDETTSAPCLQLQDGWRAGPTPEANERCRDDATRAAGRAQHTARRYPGYRSSTEGPGQRPLYCSCLLHSPSTAIMSEIVSAGRSITSCGLECILRYAYGSVRMVTDQICSVYMPVNDC
jgi:hypothetical protein